MATQQEQELEESEESRIRLSRQARFLNSRKCLFRSPFSMHKEDEEPDAWVEVCNGFQVDMQVQSILNSTQKETHKQRLEKLKQELDYIKTDSWKYKPIEELIGF